MYLQSTPCDTGQAKLNGRRAGSLAQLNRGSRLARSSGVGPTEKTHCQEPIEGYELIVAFDRERVRVTSLAREPHMVDVDCELLHSQCFEARQDDLS